MLRLHSREQMKERDYIVLAAVVLMVATAACVIALAWSVSRQLGLGAGAAIFGYAAYCCASTLKDNPEK